MLHIVYRLGPKKQTGFENGCVSVRLQAERGEEELLYQ